MKELTTNRIIIKITSSSYDNVDKHCIFYNNKNNEFIFCICPEYFKGNVDEYIEKKLTMNSERVLTEYIYDRLHFLTSCDIIIETQLILMSEIHLSKKLSENGNKISFEKEVKTYIQKNLDILKSTQVESSNEDIKLWFENENERIRKMWEGEIEI